MREKDKELIDKTDKNFNEFVKDWGLIVNRVKRELGKKSSQSKNLTMCSSERNKLQEKIDGIQKLKN